MALFWGRNRPPGYHRTMKRSPEALVQRLFRRVGVVVTTLRGELTFSAPPRDELLVERQTILHKRQLVDVYRLRRTIARDGCVSPQSTVYR